MDIRRATTADTPGLIKLLDQVLMVHYEGRPDLFRPNTRKYTDVELAEIIADDDRPIWVAVADGAPVGEILGYAFCVVQDFTHSNNMQPIKTLYIDDLCVDEEARGQHVLLQRHAQRLGLQPQGAGLLRGAGPCALQDGHGAHPAAQTS